MWHRTKTGALLEAMHLAGLRVDPEQLERRARDLGINLPVTCGTVSARSLGGTGIGWQVPRDRLVEFRAAVEQVMAGRRAA